MGLRHFLVKKKIGATTITVAACHQAFPTKNGKVNRFGEAEQRVNNQAGADGLT